MRDARPILLLLASLTAVGSAARAGDFIGLRSAYRGFDVERMARSTLEGDGMVDVFRDEVSGMLAFGAEYVNLSDRFIYNLSLDYASTEIPGSSRDHFEYVLTDSLGNVTTSEATAASQIARVSAGVGYNLVRLPSAFVYVNPTVSLEWGTWVSLDEATEQFVESGYRVPPELVVDARVRMGLNLRLFTGVSIGNGMSVAIAPSCRYGWNLRQRATRDGLVDGPMPGRALGFDVEFGVYRAITP